MARMVMDYGVRDRRRGWGGFLGGIVGLVVGAVVLWRVSAWGWAEFALQREEEGLLGVNRPAVLWKGAEVRVGERGEVELVDGRVGRLWGVRGGGNKGVGEAVTGAMKRIRAAGVGYTVVGLDEGGRPAVEIWALSPREYRGMGGNSTWVELRRGGMYLWRNVGAFLVGRGEVAGEPGERQREVSAVGW